MSFQFPLAAVLRFRESIEQREYLALERVQQDIVRVEVRIRQAQDELSVAIQKRVGELALGTRAAAMQSAYQHEKAMEQEIEQLRSLWQELKMKWRQQLATYEQARRNRESLEKLREKQLNVYDQDKAKREQAIVDDLFLARRRRR